tara:strand:- start:2 stop:937 length:936 start_codon:yes stop_codon:yes gene_type:complete
MKTLVAIPCFNEADNIQECVDSLIAHKLEKNIAFDLVIVDDGSDDQSSDIISKYKNELNVISSESNEGLAEVFNSILYFTKKNNYQRMLIFDADLQYPVGDVGDLISKLSEENLDIVIGTRDFKNIKHFRKSKKFFQIFGSFIVSKLIGVKIKDATSGFRSYSKKAVNVLLTSNKFTYTVETLFQAKDFNLKIGNFDIGTTKETRPSKLFKSDFQYIRNTFSIIIKSLILYKRNFSNFLFLFFTIPGGMLLSRFFIPYFRDGSNSGNIQSLVTGFSYLIILFLLFIYLSLYSFLTIRFNKVNKDNFNPKHT